MMRFTKGVFLAGTFLFFVGGAWGDAASSIQLVGNFEGITCEPEDPANDMDQVAEHLWLKLKFIDEPGPPPDTIWFKFTMNGSYAPEHWGWSGMWGIAELGSNPPNIAAVLADSGYYHFNFNETSYAYWLDQPTGLIEGTISSNGSPGAPPGAAVTLFDDSYRVIGTYDQFTDDTFLFEHLPPAVFHLVAGAPGHYDTTITDITVDEGSSLSFSIDLKSATAVTFTSGFGERVDGGVLLHWTVSCCGEDAGFDIFRGSEPFLESMEKRNTLPISFGEGCRFFDRCEDPTQDLYYFIVETGDERPSNYGPIFVKGIVPDIRSGLGQNYPNPFNPSTTIPYSVGPVGNNRPVTISFYDVAGRLIDSYELGPKPIGDHTFMWNPAVSRQENIPSGVYYCRLRIGKDSFTRKLILLR